MRFIASILRTCLLLLALIGGGTFFLPSAFAQKNDPPPAPTVRYYAPGYGIAIMGIVLGLLIVLRPGTRGGEETK